MLCRAPDTNQAVGAERYLSPEAREEFPNLLPASALDSPSGYSWLGHAAEADPSTLIPRVAKPFPAVFTAPECSPPFPLFFNWKSQGEGGSVQTSKPWMLPKLQN